MYIIYNIHFTSENNRHKKTDITDIDIAKDCSFACEKSRFSSKIQDFLEKQERISENQDLISGKETKCIGKQI